VIRFTPTVGNTHNLAALLRNRRGSVALMTGIMAPVMVMSLAMGIEVTSWSVTKLDLQRIADVSAWAGARQYIVTNDVRSATQTAADLAEINGAAGAASRGWSSTTSTTTDNLITAQVVGGIRSADDKAVKVTVKRSISTSFSRIFPGTQSSVTVSAVAVAEIGSVGPQPCITALGGGVDGITTGIDASVTGNASLVASGCSLRSNDGISQSGGGTIHTDGVYAGGGISGASICCDLHPNAGQITDPYATDTAVQNAFNSLISGTGTAVSVASGVTQSIGPGTYSSLDVHGTLNLSPGLYIINGNISAGAQAAISGTGVTIITSGIVSTTGGSSLTLTAPTTSPTGSAIPGVLLAGNSTYASSFLGNSTIPVTGVVYFPHAALKFGGTSSAGGGGCTELIAATVTVVGTVNLAADCSDYGTLKFGSLPGPSSIALVQ
jgi:Flp pilus assembly protein TadG